MHKSNNFDGKEIVDTINFSPEVPFYFIDLENIKWQIWRQWDWLNPRWLEIISNYILSDALTALVAGLA